jgi:hypothetical protein
MTTPYSALFFSINIITHLPAGLVKPVLDISILSNVKTLGFVLCRLILIVFLPLGITTVSTQSSLISPVPPVTKIFFLKKKFISLFV